jgi:hypothetical protein
LFSQSGDKKGKYSPVTPTTPTKFYSRLHGWVVLSVFALTLVAFLSFVILVVGPEGDKKNRERKLAHEASLEGPKVLAELLGEVRLLRLAVEKLAGQS